MDLKKMLINIYEWFYEKRRLFILRTKYRLKIMSPEKTIKYIKKNNCCIARYGDGEFDHILGSKDEHFQARSPELMKQLESVLDSKSKNLLLCIPRCFNTIKGCNEHSGTFWIEWGRRNNHHQKIVNLIRSHTEKNYLFGDSQITRPYIDWKTSDRAERIFPMLKSLWQDKDIFIIEGDQTRLGVGNDLFDGAKSIKRILAPAIGAFEKIDIIKKTIIDNYNNELIIMALGPTATILARDFSEINIQALDIGNIDIEYEWFLRGAKTRVAIEGKFTNEANDGRVFTDCNDEKYLSQIIAKIE